MNFTPNLIDGTPDVYVINETVLAVAPEKYTPKSDSWPMFQVLRDISSQSKSGSFVLVSRVDKIRLATQEDFDRFRVYSRGYLRPGATVMIESRVSELTDALDNAIDSLEHLLDNKST